LTGQYQKITILSKNLSMNIQTLQFFNKVNKKSKNIIETKKKGGRVGPCHSGHGPILKSTTTIYFKPSH